MDCSAPVRLTLCLISNQTHKQTNGYNTDISKKGMEICCNMCPRPNAESLIFKMQMTPK